MWILVREAKPFGYLLWSPPLGYLFGISEPPHQPKFAVIAVMKWSLARFEQVLSATMPTSNRSEFSTRKTARWRLSLKGSLRPMLLKQGL
jgi:hypothetical protein